MSTFNFKKLPHGFLVTIIFICFFEICIFSLDTHLYQEDAQALMMNIKNEFSQNPNNHFDMIILGDCYNLTGMIPFIVEKETGLKTYNFSTWAKQTILTSYGLLNNYLKFCERKPEIIVLGYLPMNMVKTKQEIIQASIPYMYDIKKGNIKLLFEEFGFLQTLKYLVPSLKHQAYFKVLMRNPWKWRWSHQYQIDKALKHLMIHKGFEPLYTGRIIREQIADYKLSRPLIASDFFKKYLKAIFDLAQKHNIQIIYIIPSHPPGQYLRYEKYRVAQNYDLYLNHLLKEYENVIIVKPQAVLNKRNLYESRVHLNGHGAFLLSQFIAKKIKETQ